MQSFKCEQNVEKIGKTLVDLGYEVTKKPPHNKFAARWTIDTGVYKNSSINVYRNGTVHIQSAASNTEELCSSLCDALGGIPKSTQIKQKYDTKHNRLHSIEKECTHSNTDKLSEYKRKSCHVLQFDGGARNNPGIGGAGYVLYNPDKTIIRMAAIPLGDHVTNNIAEYTGLVDGLKAAVECNIQRLIVQGDSQLVINQINGTYKVRASNLIPIYRQAISLRNKIQSVRFEWIPREQNMIADGLSNEAMDEYSSK